MKLSIELWRSFHNKLVYSLLLIGSKSYGAVAIIGTFKCHWPGFNINIFQEIRRPEEIERTTMTGNL